MTSFTFIPDEPVFNGVQATYIGLLDNPQSSDSGAMAYWESYAAANSSGAAIDFSKYVTYNGQALSSSNIANEIVNIYQNLLGETKSATDSGVAYWANQWTGNGGTMPITQITWEIFNAVQNLSPSNAYYETMNNRILTYYNEAQSLYIGLFNYSGDEPGLNYWQNYLATNPVGAQIDISKYATYNGQALSSSNIANEIVNIYQNFLGETKSTTDSGVTYWSDQWTGNGGTLPIGEILFGIYSSVENLPVTNAYYQYMNNKIQGDNYITMFKWTLGNIAANGTNPDVYTLASTDTGHTFASGAQSDTLVIPLDYQSTGLGQAGNGAYFTFQGDTSGHNAVDINYDPVYTSNISYYLQNATNFQILDFNYSQGDYSNLGNSPLDLSTINSGFNTFILGDTYNTGTVDSYSDYGFTNATDNDTFVVKATTMELDIFNSTNGNGGNTANVIMDGGTGGVGLGTLYFSPSSSGAAATVNIYSSGVTLNTIQAMGDMYLTGNNLTGSFTLNVYGSDPLSIGSATYQPYTASNNIDNGIELRDGSTLTIAGHSSSSNLTAYIYENSPTQTLGVTVNAAGFAGTLSLIDEFSSAYTSPNTFILGSGTDSVATNYYNASVTVGSGTDTIVSNAAYSTDSSYTAGVSSLNTTPGNITTIHGNITPGDQITFGTPLGIDPANWQIYPGLNSGGIPSAGTGVVITSLTAYSESGAASAASAIIAVISALEAPWDATSPNPVSPAGLLDYAGWFQYGGNTYIVNSDQGQNQVIELVGTYSLSNASIVTSAGTATITNITH